MYAMLCVVCHQLIIVIKHKYSTNHHAEEWFDGQLGAYNNHENRHELHPRTFENLPDRIYYIKLR